MKNLWADGLERGAYMTTFVSSQIDLEACTVLDLGCGYGGISLSFARRAKRIVGVDQDPERLAALAQRIREAGVTNMHLLRLDAHTLPFASGQFDVVLLNGVLEYMGVNESRTDPELLQVEALREVYRVLKPNGLVYVGIENRFYPGYLNADVHCGLPLVSMAPRVVATWISRLVAGRPFQHYIHSGWGLVRVLRRAGYDSVDLYTPLFNYQYPIVYMPTHDGRAVDDWLQQADRAQLSPEYQRMSFGRSAAVKRRMFRWLGRLGLMKLLSPCFVALARKGAGVERNAIASNAGAADLKNGLKVAS